MATFVQRTPILPGETLVSWVARVARDEAGLGPVAFLALIGLGQDDVIAGTPRALARLAALSDAPAEDLAAGAILRVGDRLYRHRGERFGRGFASHTRIRFCPICLLEDGCADRSSRGRRVGRATWLFAPVRTCTVHATPLVERPATCASDRLLDMAVVAPDDDALRALAAAATPRPISPLQAYVERRLGGEVGPAWLDGQRIDLAVRATELLGAVLLHGAERRGFQLTEAEWDAAGAEGWRYASAGPDGVRAALTELVARLRVRRAKGGPQAAFGPLFHWLRSGRGADRRGPIAAVLRDFILDTMPVAPGTDLFGVTVATRRRHSVASLAAEFRLHRRTLNRALVTTGLLPDGDPDRVEDRLSVEADAGEALAARLRTAIPSTELPHHLGCSRSEARRILSAGVLLRIGETAAGSRSVVNMVAAADAAALLADLSARSVAVATPSAGMIDPSAAAKRARLRVADLLRLILDGSLRRVERLAGPFGVRALRVDPQDVKRVLAERYRPAGLAMAEAGRRLGLTGTAVGHLCRAHDREGRPLLETVTSPGPRGRIASVTVEEVARFKTAHVDLATLAAERGVPARTLRAQLAAAGVAPILPRDLLERYLYRRADL